MEEQEFIDLVNQLAQVRPAPGHAGVFYSDSPSCAGLSSGAGQFLWFGGMRELLEFLRDHVHDLGMGPMYLDHSKLREQADHFVGRAIDGDLPLAALINQLNIALEGFIEIEWVGLFEDLVIGLDAFPLKLREDFLSERGAITTGGKAISNAQVPEFVDFLASYGV